MAHETAARPARLSRTEMTELVLPQHTNALGTVFGGTVMGWIDVCGAIAATRHSMAVTVTAAVDSLTFLQPIRLGDIVRLMARVNAAFRTSLEVEVRVEVEDIAKQERRLCSKAFLTFVSVDDFGRPLHVPPLLCETDEERAREQAAQARRKLRLSHKEVT